MRMRTHHFDIGSFFVLQVLDVKLLRGALLQPLVLRLHLWEKSLHAGHHYIGISRLY